MSDDSYSNEFNDLFEQTPADTPLSAAERREIEKIASETLIRGYQALQQGQLVVRQMTEEAIRKTEEAHPGFIKRYQDPETCKRFIEQRPAVARAILNAEAGQGTDSLPELYDIFVQTTGTYEQPNRGSVGTPASGSASVLSLQQINRLPVEQRREHIEALGDRVADVSIDAADPGNEVFRIERGEQ